MKLNKEDIKRFKLIRKLNHEEDVKIERFRSNFPKTYKVLTRLSQAGYNYMFRDNILELEGDFDLLNKSSDNNVKMLDGINKCIDYLIKFKKTKPKKACQLIIRIDQNKNDKKVFVIDDRYHTVPETEMFVAS